SGPRAITGSLQVSPSPLSLSAMLRLGRQENHIRYVPASLTTVMSKHVPSAPPRTGFFSYLTHPVPVCALDRRGSPPTRTRGPNNPTMVSASATSFIDWTRIVIRSGPVKYRTRSRRCYGIGIRSSTADLEPNPASPDPAHSSRAPL